MVSKEEVTLVVMVLLFMFAFANVIVFLVPGNPNIANNYKDFLARFMSWMTMFLTVGVMLLLRKKPEGKPERERDQQDRRPQQQQQQQQRPPQNQS